MEREAFLDNIVKQLKRTRSQTPPESEFANNPIKYGGESTPLPLIEDRIGSFKTELETLEGTMYLEENPEAANRRLRWMINELNLNKTVSWAKEEFAGWSLDWIWNEAGCLSYPNRAEAQVRQSEWLPKALEANAGITTAAFAIAETGSLLLYTAPGKPRSVSLLPKHHIALVFRAQLVSRLDDALARVPCDPECGLPSGCFLITGPSRTSDIENDLTIGVHGPAHLTVIIA